MYKIIYFCNFIDVTFYISFIHIVPCILHRFCIKNLKKTALYFIFAVYFSGVFSVVGLPDFKDFTVDFGVNVIPFVDMISDLKNAVLNVVLFIPLGFLLPAFSEKFRSLKNTLIFGIGMTVAIEILQIFTYRLTDVNDLITNTLGTLLGYFVMNMIIKKKKFQPIGDAKGVFIACGLAFAVNVVAVPYIAGIFWNIFYA